MSFKNYTENHGPLIRKMKEKRKTLGMNTAHVGEICGVSARTVESWESGRYTPSKPAMMLLASWLKEQGDSNE